MGTFAELSTDSFHGEERKEDKGDEERERRKKRATFVFSSTI